MEKERTGWTIEYPPCSERGKEFLYDVGRRELRSDVFKCGRFYILDSELHNLSAQRQCIRGEHAPSLPKRTLSGGSTVVVGVPFSQDFPHFSKLGDQKDTSCPCRSKKGVTPNYKDVSHLILYKV